MPGMDGTGPMGMGPGTGWGRGICGPERRVFGRRRIGFSGRFAGRGPCFYPLSGSRKEALQNEKAWLEECLKEVNDSLDEI